MISRCNSPRKPQRKPKPSAAEVSISNENLASLRRSLPMARRSVSKLTACAGHEPTHRRHLRREEANALDVIGRVGAHHADAAVLLHHAVDHANQHDDAE